MKGRTEAGHWKEIAARDLSISILLTYLASARDGFVKTLLANSWGMFIILIHPCQEVSSQEPGEAKARVTSLCHFFQWVALVCCFHFWVFKPRASGRAQN